MLSAFAPLGAFANPAQMAAMALQQNGGGMHSDVKLEVEEKEGKKRKKRNYKPRDPNAPKRPLTAYFRYLGDVRGSISEDLQKHPEKYKDIAGQPGDISRIATQRWSQMTDAEKEPYKQAYQEELKDYTIKADEYTRSKGVPLDALGEGDITAITDADEDAPADSPVALGAVAKLDNPPHEDESSDSSSSSDDSDADEPIPPPKAATPKKSALKKNKASAVGSAPNSSAPQQTFSSIPTPAFSSINEDPAPSSSPTRKRKSEAAEAEGTKKRGRKATVTAGADPTPLASSPEASSKKDKKKRKGRGDA